MQEIAIQVSDLGKEYHLGLVGTGTLSHDLRRWWHVSRGKEDPYLKLGEENIKDAASSGKKGEYIWALQHISFSVPKGEVFGIIGKNGAGKTTLLKILSRVTSPTIGEFRVKGRIASLLEVGTGFHPDLTGKENIFLNGALLGMTKSEISERFDEIAAFSGIERYLDTPVKRYSSGMFVRLAFAVAAHLNAEILVMDEILASGDADFQKKCLGKMKDVAGEGRTVLFVSHNMTAIRSLCNRALLLENGLMKFIGPTAEAVNRYITKGAKGPQTLRWDEGNAPGNEYVRLLQALACNRGDNSSEQFTTQSEIELEFNFRNNISNGNINISLHLYTMDDVLVLASPSKPVKASNGMLRFKCRIPSGFLNSIAYRIELVYVNNSRSVFVFPNVMQFEITEPERKIEWFGKWPGAVRPKFEWEEKIIS